jgi:hypothetical protein
MDPGKLCLGWCVWTNKVLTHAGLSVVVVPPRTTVKVLAYLHWWNIRGRWTGCPNQVYVEQMSLNSGRDRTRGKAIRTGNDLLLITNIAASVTSMLGGELVHVPVSTWKGSCEKTVTKNRVLNTLDKEELGVLEAALLGVKQSLHHNLFDAAGLGLHATGRYRIRGGQDGMGTR